MFKNLINRKANQWCNIFNLDRTEIWSEWAQE